MANKPNRSRGRGRKPGNNANRSFESNGPDVKIRGNASHISEKYQQLARDAAASGDRIGAENYLQHAEHYYRLVLETQQQNQQQREQREQQRAAAEAEGGSDADSGDTRGEKADGGREGGNRRRGRRRRDNVQENGRDKVQADAESANSDAGSSDADAGDSDTGEAEVIKLNANKQPEGDADVTVDDGSSESGSDDAVVEPA